MSTLDSSLITDISGNNYHRNIVRLEIHCFYTEFKHAFDLLLNKWILSDFRHWVFEHRIPKFKRPIRLMLLRMDGTSDVPIGCCWFHYSFTTFWRSTVIKFAKLLDTIQIFRQFHIEFLTHYCWNFLISYNLTRLKWSCNETWVSIDFLSHRYLRWV